MGCPIEIVTTITGTPARPMRNTSSSGTRRSSGRSRRCVAIASSSMRLNYLCSRNVREVSLLLSVLSLCSNKSGRCNRLPVEPVADRVVPARLAQVAELHFFAIEDAEDVQGLELAVDGRIGLVDALPDVPRAAVRIRIDIFKNGE